ncbi:MAG: ATP-dependent DNA helicase RecG [bacterium]
MAQLRLNSPLQYVRGVGPRKAEVLAEQGLNTVWDLLHYYPRQYLDRTTVVPIAKAEIDRPVTIIGRVRAHGILHGKRRRYEVILEDDTGAISCVWFAGIRFWERTFKKNMIFAATGTPTFFMGRQLVHPDLERLEDDSDKMIHAGRIIPVYPQTSKLTKVGLGSKGLRRTTALLLENLTEPVADAVPAADLARAALLPMDTALRKVHFPDNRDQIEACRRRLAFDELLMFQFLIMGARHRRTVQDKPQVYQPPGEQMRAFRSQLPFEFTPGQKKAIKQIFDDLRTPRPMARLLQGDVGCGKTVVAIAAALYVAENGYQAAFMAPTEILAEQHYRNWSSALEKLGVTSGLLTSSLKAAQKKKLAQACDEGTVQVLFGTHALIYDYVSFKRLGLVIIDEQHRFGVSQRGKLHAKGDNPDMLAMTATPIPRSLALTLYGDLDVSTIPDLPPGRREVRTVWRSEAALPGVYQFLKDEIGRGGQAYIIYPIIEKSYRLDLQNVEDAFKELSQGHFKGLRLGMVHGRVKSEERDKILADFYSGDLDVLLATTVVEVGLDNPRATLMVIEHAERFGLAQLHQLRGRVGRGKKESTVVAVARGPLSDLAQKRLEYFTGTTDGFEIAEADMELRGPGEMFGTRQSGLPELRLTRLAHDQDLIAASRALLERLFEPANNLDGTDQKLYNYLKENTADRRGDLRGG